MVMQFIIEICKYTKIVYVMTRYTYEKNKGFQLLSLTARCRHFQLLYTVCNVFKPNYGSCSECVHDVYHLPVSIKCVFHIMVE